MTARRPWPPRPPLRADDSGTRRGAVGGCRHRCRGPSAPMLGPTAVAGAAGGGHAGPPRTLWPLPPRRNGIAAADAPAIRRSRATVGGGGAILPLSPPRPPPFAPGAAANRRLCWLDGRPHHPWGGRRRGSRAPYGCLWASEIRRRASRRTGGQRRRGAPRRWPRPPKPRRRRVAGGVPPRPTAAEAAAASGGGRGGCRAGGGDSSSGGCGRSRGGSGSGGGRRHDQSQRRRSRGRSRRATPAASAEHRHCGTWQGRGDAGAARRQPQRWARTDTPWRRHAGRWPSPLQPRGPQSLRITGARGSRRVAPKGGWGAPRG